VVFNSLTFAVFFAIVLLLHRLPFPWTVKKANLLIASYVFYAAWNPPFVILLWISTIVDFQMARLIDRESRQGRRKLLLLVSLVLNLGMLGYFKYGEFLLENWQQFVGMFGVTWQAPDWDIVLPVGISFYTFQTLAYTLDVYLKRAAPTRSFLDFALFVTFFPQLVAGPIVRPLDLVPQFALPRRATTEQLLWGLALITLGLFSKIVIADEALAPIAEAGFDATTPLPMIDAWAAVMAFSGQIFCDFAGYSTAAIGTSMCFGWSLPDNFRFPYAAIGFSDFWRRWHISLSTWLRDYLYIPLGGNQRGPSRTYVNLMLTMLLGGLWHGASWTFVVWGGLHGLYLGIERWARSKFARLNSPPSLPTGVALALATYILVLITWVFFRAKDFAAANLMLGSMFGAYAATVPKLWTIQLLVVAVVMALMFTVHWNMRDRRIEDVVERTPAWLVGIVWGSMAFAIAIAQGSGNAFIYFQF
jgi:alginate O-acetyltransferase complex protein AlgI